VNEESRTDLYHGKAVEDEHLLLLPVTLRLVALFRYLHHPRCARYDALDEAIVYKPDSLEQQEHMSQFLHK
jgi:hypothetical protein